MGRRVLGVVGLIAAGCGDNVEPPAYCPRGEAGEAWTEIEVPGLTGRVVGASGALLVVEGDGVQLSVDGGDTWRAVELDLLRPYEVANQFSPDPRASGGGWLVDAERDTLAIAADGEVVRTTAGWPIAPNHADGGAIWYSCMDVPGCGLVFEATSTAVTYEGGGNLLDLATFAADPSRIVAIEQVVVGGQVPGGQLVVSIDAGQTWTDAHPDEDVLRIEGGAGPLELWAHTRTRLLHSADGGDTWTEIDRDVYGVAPSQTVVGRGYVVGWDRRIEVTDDGGATWTAIDAPALTRSVAETGAGALVASSVDGLLRHDGSAWEILDAPLQAMSPAAISPIEDVWLISRYDDLGSITWRRADLEAPWTIVGLLLHNRPLPGRHDVIYGRSRDQIVRSTDRGLTWEDRGNAARSVVPSPEPDVVYGRVQLDPELDVAARSVDGGQTFEELGLYFLWHLRVDPFDAGRVYVHGTGDRIEGRFDNSYVSEDYGESWEGASCRIASMTLDPYVEGRVWCDYDEELVAHHHDGRRVVAPAGGPSFSVVEYQSIVPMPGGTLLVVEHATQSIWELRGDRWTRLADFPYGDAGVATIPGCPDALLVAVGDALYVGANRGRTP